MNNTPICHTWEKYGMRPGAEIFPLMVIVAFSYVCNARCPNCAFTAGDVRKHFADVPFMPTELFKKLADETGKHNSFLRITGGGEPLLHPQAMELFEYAKSQGCKLGVISNGSCYDRTKLERLILAGVDTLEFSVDAGNPIDYAYARAGLDWRKLNENVQMAMELREKHKSGTRIICSIINQANVDVEQAKQYWEPYADVVQVRKFLTWRVNDPGQSADPTPYLPPEENIPCPLLFERTMVTPRGEVNFCGVDRYNTYSAGSLTEHTLQEIWSGKVYQHARELHLKGMAHDVPPCNNCPDRAYRSWNYNFWKIIQDSDGSQGKCDDVI